jgi:hypothetical protein
VDRKDLDRQTREEFNRFQEGCVEENTNTGALVRRMLSDDAADKVIVCTIQKLGLALDENSKRNKSRERRGLATYTDQLEALRDKRIVFIFDECHRSQFGDNHQAIKEFFPKAQLFGFTGTPIFEANAIYKRIEGDVQTLKTTQDLFHQSLHEYTITHAIEDRNVLRFHVDYYKPDGKNPPKQGETLAKRAIVDAILAKLKKARKCFLRREPASAGFVVQETDSTPFLYHLSSLVELHQAQQSSALYTHHFNMMRRVMEQTACFFGYTKWEECIKPEEDDPNGTVYKRVIDLMSHGDYSLYEPREMMQDNKEILSRALRQFIKNHPFSTALFAQPNDKAQAA